MKTRLIQRTPPHPVGEVLRRKAQRKVSTRAFLLHAICIPNLALSRL